VIGAFDRAAAVGQVLSQLERQGILAVDVSVLAPAAALAASGDAPRGSGPLGGLGRAARWLGAPRELERAGVGKLTGTGALAEVLGQSPTTSPVGAIVMQGVPQRDAVVYADLLAGGKILLLVGVADRTLGERVRSLLEAAGAEHARYYAGRPYGTAYHGSGPGLPLLAQARGVSYGVAVVLGVAPAVVVPLAFGLGEALALDVLDVAAGLGDAEPPVAPTVPPLIGVGEPAAAAPLVEVDAADGVVAAEGEVAADGVVAAAGEALAAGVVAAAGEAPAAGVAFGTSALP
jgi:hypothetical protein